MSCSSSAAISLPEAHSMQRTQDLRSNGERGAARMLATARALDDIAVLTPLLTFSPYRTACMRAFAA